MSDFWRVRLSTLLVTVLVTLAVTGDVGMASKLSLCLVAANTLTMWVMLQK